MPARTPVPPRTQRDAVEYPTTYALLAARHAERELWLDAQERRQASERAAERRSVLDRAYDTQQRSAALSSLTSARVTATMAIRCDHQMVAALCVHCAPLLTSADDVTLTVHADTLASDAYTPSKRTASQRPSKRNVAQTGKAAPSSVVTPRGTLRKSDPLSRDGWQGDQTVTVSVAQHVPTASDLTFLAQSTADLYRTTKSRRRRYRRAMIDAEIRARAAQAALAIVRSEATIEITTRPAYDDGLTVAERLANPAAALDAARSAAAQPAARHAARSIRDQEQHPDPRIAQRDTQSVAQPADSTPALSERAARSQAQARAIRDSIRAAAAQSTGAESVLS